MLMVQIPGQVRLDLAGLGLSVVTGSQEILYTRAGGIKLRATVSKARHTLELAIAKVQACSS